MVAGDAVRLAGPPAREAWLHRMAGNAVKMALCVGINEYAGLPGARLSGCVADAQDWSAALSERGYVVDTLTDGAAPRGVILTSLRTMVKHARRGDTVLFQFSGHGSWRPDASGDEPDGRDETICAHDVASGGQISDDELAAAFGKRAWGVRAVMISDSCHSGSVSRFVDSHLDQAHRSSKADPQRQGSRRFLAPEAFLRGADLQRADLAESLGVPLRKPRPNALLLSGCGDLEYSYDAVIDGRPRGAMSWAALTTLAALPPSASYATWHREIRKLLPSASYPQTPVLSGSPFQRYGKALG